MSALLQMMTTAGDFSFSLIYSVQNDGSDARQGIVADSSCLTFLNQLGKFLKGFGILVEEMDRRCEASHSSVVPNPRRGSFNDPKRIDLSA
jgi:hypothetical protein